MTGRASMQGRGSRRRAAAVAALVCAAVAWPRPARAEGELARLLPWIEADAALIVRLEPGPLDALGAALRSAPEGARLLGLASAASAAVLGFNPLVRRGWSGAGLGGGPALVQIAAIDRERAWRAEPGDRDAPLWRSRYVVVAAEPDTAVAAIGRAFALRDRVDPASGDPALVARLVGAPRARGPAVARALASRGVFVLARLPALGAVVIGHRHGPVVAVDVLVPFAGGRLNWAEHGSALLRRLSPGPALALEGAGALLAEPGVALWLRPGPLVAALEAAEWQAAPPGSAARRRARCRPLRDLESGAAITGAAARLSADGGALAVELRFDARDPAALSAALATGPGPLLSPAADGLAVGAALRLASVAGLRALPRPLLLSAPWEAPFRSASACGPGAWAALIAFGWPQLAGLFVDEVAELHPDAAALVEALGGLAAAAPTLRADLRQGIAAAEAALDPAAAAIVSRWFDVVFGHRRERGEVVHWGRGRLRAYRRGAVFGFATGADAARWAVSAPRLDGASVASAVPAASVAPGPIAPAPPIAELHADLAAVRAADLVPAPWSLLAALGSRLDAALSWQDGAVVVRLRISRH